MPADGRDEALSSLAVRISATFDGWLGAGAAVQAMHAGDPRAEALSLYPDEQAAIGRAHPRRQADFRLGRAAARQALRALGIESSVPRAPDGAPVWPPGLVGSLSHCGSLACAAVAPADRFRSIGLDIQTAAPLPPEIAEQVCRPDEQVHHRALPVIEGATWDILTFSAKEAVYKCRRPVTGRFLDFADLSLRFAGTGPGLGYFSVHQLITAQPRPAEALAVAGRWFVDSGLVGTAALWLAPELQYAGYNSVADSAPGCARSPVN